MAEQQPPSQDKLDQSTPVQPAPQATEQIGADPGPLTTQYVRKGRDPGRLETKVLTEGETHKK